jgi:hypothetical protein
MIGHVLEKELFVGVKLYPVVFAAGPETVTFTVPVLIHRASMVAQARTCNARKTDNSDESTRGTNGSRADAGGSHDVF